MREKLIIFVEQLDRKDIKKYIKDIEWQEIRISMKGQSLDSKIEILNNWWLKNQNKAAKVQIINYINALKRSLYSKEIYKYLY